MKTVLLSGVFVLFFSFANAKTKLSLAVFTSNGKVLAEKSITLPVKNGTVLEARSGHVSCETGSLANVAAGSYPLHLTLIVHDQMTTFNGDVILGRPTYISLHDQYFCSIDLK